MFASKANDVLRIKKLNTLFISYDGMTDSLGQSQVIPYLIGLSKKGFSISIISCEKSEAFSKNADYISNLLSENDIQWFPIPYTKKPPVFSTIWDIIQIRKKLYQLHAANNFQLIHCRSYISSIIAAPFCKKNNIPFVFDMRGFWADERVEGKIWNLKKPLFNFIYNYFKKKELEFFNQASAIVSLTECGKKEIQSFEILPAQKNNIHVIPCSADFDLFSLPTLDQKVKARSDAGIPSDAFVITYLGSLGTWYLLDEMLDFFKVFKSKNPQAVFCIITADSQESVLKVAERKGIAVSDIFVSAASRKQVVEKLAASDWGISFIQPSYSKKASSPTKMGEMLAMGIPLLVNSKVGDVQEIIEHVRGGFCLQSFDFNSYVKAADFILLYQEEALKIREKSFEIYSLQKAVDKYELIYKTILMPKQGI